MKLYKFRSLTRKDDLKRVSKILRTGRFYYSGFSELNDPMEGAFTIYPKNNQQDSNIINTLYGEKNRYKICSFSAAKALQEPTMWGHYANGFKGVVIEILTNEEDKLYPINYQPNISYIENGNNVEEKAINILTTKLDSWGKEVEYRSLREMGARERLYKVGTISALYFGNPYGHAVNKKRIFKKNPVLKKFEKEREELKNLALKKGIKCYSVKIENNRVVKHEELTILE